MMILMMVRLKSAGTSTKAFLKGVETWKKETIMKKVIKLLLSLTEIQYAENMSHIIKFSITIE